MPLFPSLTTNYIVCVCVCVCVRACVRACVSHGTNLILCAYSVSIHCTVVCVFLSCNLEVGTVLSKRAMLFTKLTSTLQESTCGLLFLFQLH